MLEAVEKKTVYTVQKQVSRSGVGVFSGAPSQIQFSPLPAGSGVVLRRGDLPGAPSFRLDLSLVQGTPRCTVVGNEHFSVQTVEHLTSALYAYDVSDILVDLTGPEIPIFDGSSLVFVEMLEEAGLRKLGEQKVYTLAEPLYWSNENTHLVALPSKELRISYTLHYPQSSCIGTQFCSVVFDKERFVRDIAPCRTFSVYEEILPLIEKGLLKGSLDNAVIIKENRVFNPEGLRFPDEMVRHKVLDLIGDLSLMGLKFSAHILAVRSGHYANNAFANVLLSYFKKEGL